MWNFYAHVIFLYSTRAHTVTPNDRLTFVLEQIEFSNGWYMFILSITRESHLRARARMKENKNNVDNDCGELLFVFDILARARLHVRICEGGPLCAATMCAQI